MFTLGPKNLTAGYTAKRNELAPQMPTAQMSITSSFQTGPKWKQLKCPSVVDCITNGIFLQQKKQAEIKNDCCTEHVR
jgi:hypothetical protein